MAAAHNRIDVVRFEFNAVTGPAGALGRDGSCDASKERIEHDVRTSGAVQKSIR
jgi:hypothetical protein